MMFGLAWNEIIAVILLVGSLFFFLASAIGMIRLPDFYSRLHASGNSETMGLMLACLGLVFYEGPTLTAIKIVIIFLLVFGGLGLAFVIAGAIVLSNEILKYEILHYY